MPKAIRGVLVECDPSIKAIIVKINKDDNEYIVEDLDDQHLVIKESMVNQLKAALDKALENTQQAVPESGDEA